MVWEMVLCSLRGQRSGGASSPTGGQARKAQGAWTSLARVEPSACKLADQNPNRRGRFAAPRQTQPRSRERRMIGFKKDDGGRRAAGSKGTAGDCVARALAIATGRPYRECYDALAEANYRRRGVRSARNGIAKGDRNAVLEAFGLRKIKLPMGPKPTFSEAWRRYQLDENGRAVRGMIVSTTRHICAITWDTARGGWDGILRDEWDCRTYEMSTTLGRRNGVPFMQPGGTRERKAMSVWVAE